MAKQVSRFEDRRLVVDEDGNFFVERLSRDKLGERRWNTCANFPVPPEPEEDDEGYVFSYSGCSHESVLPFLQELARFKDLDEQRRKILVNIAKGNGARP